MVFGFIFGKSQPKKKSVEYKPLDRSLRQIILSTLGNRGLPAMPANAQKAFAISTNPNADLKDLQEVIESDEALSSRILKISNSVYYDRGKSSKTVAEALTIIGLAEAKTFLSSTYLNQFFSQSFGIRALLWHHDIAVAILAKWLSEVFQLKNSELYFLAGLMHDIGKIILHMRLGPDYEKIFERAGTVGFLKAESDVFPFDHTEVGVLIAEEWRFGEELKSAIQNHHKQNLEPLSIEGLTQLADLTAHSLGLGHPRGFYGLQDQSKKQLENFQELLSKQFESTSDYLKQASQCYADLYDLYN